MKIRTDFVTNSSSYVTTEVVIDNPVLLEILQKYKDMGLFAGKEPIFGIGTYDTVDAEYKKSGPSGYIDYDAQTKTPAFFYIENQNEDGEPSLSLVWDYWPKSLEDVLSSIIEILNSADDYIDGELRDRLVQELDQKNADVLQAYKYASWSSRGWGDEMDYRALLSHDPITGTKYECKGYNVGRDIYGEEDWDWN